MAKEQKHTAWVGAAFLQTVVGVGRGRETQHNWNSNNCNNCAHTHTHTYKHKGCFKGLPVCRFGHVSSNVPVADSVHNSVVMSALNRHLITCGDFDNVVLEVVLEVARMVVALRKSDYSPRKVRRAVKRFVVYRAAGDQPHVLFAKHLP